MRFVFMRNGFVAMTLIFAAGAPIDARARCIGVAVPVAEGIQGDAGAVQNAVRDLLAKNLTTGAIAATPLQASARAAALDESKKAACECTLLTSVRRKAGGSGAGKLMEKVAEGAGRSAAWSIPGGGFAGGVARGTALYGMDAIVALAGSTKAKDEFRIEYQVVAVDGKPVIAPRTEHAKASADGEDVLTPLITRVAEQIHSGLESSSR
jgi:hypothetical protein